MNEKPLTNSTIPSHSSSHHLKIWVIILAIIATAGIGYSVYAWLQYRQLSSDITSKNNQIADLQKQKSDLSNSTASQKTSSATQTVDPYAGWKTYCDAVEKVCFKYPSDWSLNATGQANLSTVSLKNPAQTLTGTFLNNDERDGTLGAYYVAAVEDLGTVNANYKVLGGFAAAATPSYPEYKVVDTKFTTGLTVGQQANMETTARFTFNDAKSGSLWIYPTVGMTTTQAKTWFTSNDGKTAELIAKSLYFE